MASVTLHPDPSERFPVMEFQSGGQTVASITIDETPVIISGGDAAIVAVTGALIDRLTALRSAAVERHRIAIGQQALPDALDPATMADALAGWAPGELAEAYGS